VELPDCVLSVHMDEGTGNKIYDSSGYGNDGTIVNATWVDGKFGKGLMFGASKYVNILHSESLNINGSITVALWCKKTEVWSDRYRVLCGKTDYNPWGLITEPNSGNPWNFNVWKNGVRNRINGPSLPLDEWTFITGTYNADTGVFSVYHNGILYDSRNIGVGSIDTSTNNVRISTSGSTGAFLGDIDEVHIYNRALTDNEIKLLYEGQQYVLKNIKTFSNESLSYKPTSVDGNGLILYVPFVEGDGNTLRDYSSYSAVGTAINLEWNNDLILDLRLNEISGLNAYDSSGYGNDGVISGTTWVDGTSGKALLFNEMNDQLTVNNSDTLNPTKQLSIATNITPTTVNQPVALIIEHNTESVSTYTSWLTTLGFNVIVDTTVTSVQEVAAYNPSLIVGLKWCWGITNTTLFNQLYEAGYNIFTNGNDTVAGITPINTVTWTNVASGTIVAVCNHPLTENWTSNTSGSDGRQGITSIHVNAIAIAKDSVNNYIEAVYLEETNKGRWYHYQPSTYMNSNVFNNTIIYLTRHNIISKGLTYNVYIRNNSDTLYAYINNRKVTGTLTLNVPNHVVLSYDNNVQKLYINNELVNSNMYTEDITTDDKNVIVGKEYYGIIDDVKVFKRALIPYEITKLFNLNEYYNGLTPYGEFNGASYVTFEHAEQYDVNELTIATWIKTPSTINTGYHCVLSKHDGSPETRDYNFYIWSATTSTIDKLHFSSAIFGNSVATLPASFNVNEWHHIAVTVSSTGYITYYADGVPFYTVQGTAGNANHEYPIWIGRGDNYYKGGIKHLYIFNRALTSTEILSLITTEEGLVKKVKNITAEVLDEKDSLTKKIEAYKLDKLGRLDSTIKKTKTCLTDKIGKDDKTPIKKVKANKSDNINLTDDAVKNVKAVQYEPN